MCRNLDTNGQSNVVNSEAVLGIDNSSRLVEEVALALVQHPYPEEGVREEGGVGGVAEGLSLGVQNTLDLQS